MWELLGFKIENNKNKSINLPQIHCAQQKLLKVQSQQMFICRPKYSYSQMKSGIIMKKKMRWNKPTTVDKS